ncbi:MAG: phosphoribosyltransferase family protein [Candidatus Babeliales bacterium]
MKFKDRTDAAQKLAAQLAEYKNNPNVVIIAIPRGGLAIGTVLAKELHAPLDVIFTKKIGFPGNPEYAIGAASLDAVTIHEQFAQDPIFKEYVDEQVPLIREMLKKRYNDYKGAQQPISLAHKIVIVTDDGIATGQTMELTIQLIKKEQPLKIILAIPVAPHDALEDLERYVDGIACVYEPPVFHGVGQFYESFEQVSDKEAIQLLHEAATIR